MSRSAWKGFFVDSNIVRRFDELLSLAFSQFKEQNRDQLQDVKIDFNSRIFYKEYMLDVLTVAMNLSVEDPIEVWSRGSLILPEFEGFTFLIYNGHVFQRIRITDEMVGKRFGEFAVTKRLGIKIHYPKKKKKK